MFTSLLIVRCCWRATCSESIRGHHTRQEGQQREREHCTGSPDPDPHPASATNGAFLTQGSLFAVPHLQLPQCERISSVISKVPSSQRILWSAWRLISDAVMQWGLLSLWNRSYLRHLFQMLPVVLVIKITTALWSVEGSLGEYIHTCRVTGSGSQIGITSSVTEHHLFFLSAQWHHLTFSSFSLSASPSSPSPLLPLSPSARKEKDLRGFAILELEESSYMIRSHHHC